MAGFGDEARDDHIGTIVDVKRCISRLELRLRRKRELTLEKDLFLAGALGEAGLPRGQKR